jgi:hypothetical protein
MSRFGNRKGLAKPSVLVSLSNQERWYIMLQQLQSKGH